jgi:cytidylate kinase
MIKNPVVTIDGPAGAGKSTISRLIAARFSFFYLDTGALYRALAYLVDERHLPERTDEVAAEVSQNAVISVSNESGNFRISANGQDVSSSIRSEKIGLLASRISALLPVRENLLDIQRRIAVGGGVVAEGRDMGTVVFPDAEVKFYLEASVQERAKRRHLELATRGEAADLAEIERDIINRDRQDKERAIAPLRIPSDALAIDSTDKSIAEVVENMALRIEQFLKVR